MKTGFATLAVLLLLFSATYGGWVIDTENGGVQILRQVNTSSDGRNYRYDLQAHNGKSSPVYVKIYLTSCNNCYDGLITGNALLEAGTTVSVGSVQQANSTIAWSYTYHFQWTDATNQ